MEQIKIKSIRKKLGAIDLSSQFSKLIKYRIPTGIIAIDKVIGGGIPSGKLTELYGGWSAGKTRIVLHVVAQVLKLGGWAVLVDAERALEAGLCELANLDVNHPKFIYVNPDKIETIEDVFKFTEKVIAMIREEDSDGYLALFWDSLAATPTKEDLDEKEDVSKNANIAAARRAKLIGRGIRRLSSKLFKTHSCFVIVNQLRDKFDVMFGESETTPGGRAVKFHASLRMKLKLIKKIKDKKTNEQIGNSVRLVVEKSRIGFPFGVVNFKMMVYEPISLYAGLLDFFVRHSEIEDLGRGGYKYFDSEEEFKEKDFPKVYEKRLKNVKKS